ncbi:hypothetical protein [Desulfitibacter alkalitolerans]|uniref:hypothetical protein n=1 Tax=Desulfitibacter alkalitolerans TaxID=264641 RepID=UPI00047F103D|nr:hypothetical protein [Desulfitibacter alkalitolerans]
MRKDVIIFGSLAGIIGNVVKLIVSLPLYYTGLIDKTYIHIASGYYSDENLECFFAFINGLLTDLIYAAFLGVLFYLALRYTDMKYAKLKGILFGGFIHVVNNGVLVFEGFNKALFDDPNAFFLFFPTIIFGLTTCWAIERFEKEH